jgi:hypothetical protein
LASGYGLSYFESKGFDSGQPFFPHILSYFEGIDSGVAQACVLQEVGIEPDRAACPPANWFAAGRLKEKEVVAGLHERIAAGPAKDIFQVDVLKRKIASVPHLVQKVDPLIGNLLPEREKKSRIFGPALRWNVAYPHRIFRTGTPGEEGEKESSQYSRGKGKPE